MSRQSGQSVALQPVVFVMAAGLGTRMKSDTPKVPIVRELLATLPDALAEALALHVVLGYTVVEIAESASLPVETVRSRLRLAKQALRKRVLNNPKLREAAGSRLEAEA